MKFALVFPGQGSQKLGMMDAYGDHPVIRETFAEASAALGRDLWQLVSAGPAVDAGGRYRRLSFVAGQGRPEAGAGGRA